jgi:hypothetical protein
VIEIGNDTQVTLAKELDSSNILQQFNPTFTTPGKEFVTV